MQESSRGADHGSDLCFHVFVYAGRSLQARSYLPGRVQVRWHALRLHKPRRVLELRAVDEGTVPASAPATSRLFVLPVATRRSVLTNNRGIKEKRKECGPNCGLSMILNS